jgi:hypothetical protein
MTDHESNLTSALIEIARESNFGYGGTTLSNCTDRLGEQVRNFAGHAIARWLAADDRERAGLQLLYHLLFASEGITPGDAADVVRTATTRALYPFVDVNRLASSVLEHDADQHHEVKQWRECGAALAATGERLERQQ